MIALTCSDRLAHAVADPGPNAACDDDDEGDNSSQRDTGSAADSTGDRKKVPEVDAVAEVAALVAGVGGNGVTATHGQGGAGHAVVDLDGHGGLAVTHKIWWVGQFLLTLASLVFSVPSLFLKVLNKRKSLKIIFVHLETYHSTEPIW